MRHRRDAYDNAVAETFFATLETELLDRTRFATRNQARSTVFDYIEGFYNPLRRRIPLTSRLRKEHPSKPSYHLNTQAENCPQERGNSSTALPHEIAQDHIFGAGRSMYLYNGR